MGLFKLTKSCPIHPDRARIMGHPINAYCSELLRRRRRQPPMMSSSNWKIFWVRIVVRVTDLCTNNRQANRQGIWQKTLKLLKKCPQNYDENKMSDINRFFEPKLNVSLTILYKDMENFYTKAKIESNGETWGFSFMILFDICICVIYIYVHMSNVLHFWKYNGIIFKSLMFFFAEEDTNSNRYYNQFDYH